MMKYGLSDETIKKIQSVFSNYNNISKVILYGSRAKGDYKNGSDIDLSVFGKDIELKELHKIELELDNLLLPYKIDLNIYKKLKNEDLKNHIQRVGKEFYKALESTHG